MNKIEEIFTAFRISFNPNSEQFDLASKRIMICNDCEFKSILELTSTLTIARCSVCGCILKGKIYTVLTYQDPSGSCPKEKWKSVEEQWLIEKQSQK